MPVHHIRDNVRVSRAKICANAGILSVSAQGPGVFKALPGNFKVFLGFSVVFNDVGNPDIVTIVVNATAPILAKNPIRKVTAGLRDGVTNIATVNIFRCCSKRIAEFPVCGDERSDKGASDERFHLDKEKDIFN